MSYNEKTALPQYTAGIVASLFHAEITEPMVTSAAKVLEASGVRVGSILRVPGAYEFPLAVQRVLDDRDTELAVVLGYIEKGETLHGEVMGHVVHRSLIDLQLEHRKPIGLGIIGPGASSDQAEARKIEYAEAAARAALHMHELLVNKM